MVGAGPGVSGDEVSSDPGPEEEGRGAKRRRVVDSVKRSLAERLAEAWRAEPERLATAVELGVINPDWVDAPGEHQFSSAAPIEVVERFLERTTEQRPSMLASLGLTALQVLNSIAADGSGETGGQSSRLVVMFTDLEGFTAFTATNGDEAASSLLASHHRVVGPVVRGRGGKIVKRLGDGLLLTFPTAEGACLAALEMVGTSPPPLRLRAGSHLGDVMVSRHDVLGHVVNIAARVTDRARGGEVLATEASASASVKFGRVRLMRLKGISERVGVCRVTPAVADR